MRKSCANYRYERNKVFYELHGTGKPLVLIAGYTGDHTFWNLILNKLVNKFQVLIFDNRAIGQTKDTNTPFTLEMMAEDTMALVKQLVLKIQLFLDNQWEALLLRLLQKIMQLKLIN